jgi:hypothetical protein
MRLYLQTAATHGYFVHTPDDMIMAPRYNKADRGKPKDSEKTCPSATLSTTNLIWNNPDANPDLRGDRPTTNRLSHGIVIFTINITDIISITVNILIPVAEM